MSRRRDKRLDNKQWLYQKYWAEHLSLSQIAEILGCTPSTVWIALKLFSIPRRTYSEANTIYNELYNKEWLYQKYWVEGLSLQQIAERFGCDHELVRYALKKLNIKRRTLSEAVSGERNGHYGKLHTEEAKRKMSEAHWGEKSYFYGKHFTGENNSNWQGGVSFAPYCPKFNNRFKEYIRDKFDRVCFLCGKNEKENERKLSVHHVNYNKNCGCEEGASCQFVPLCTSCHAKTHHNREYWEKVITTKLHGKINGWYI